MPKVRADHHSGGRADVGWMKWDLACGERWKPFEPTHWEQAWTGVPHFIGGAFPMPFLVVSAGSHGAKVQVLPATSLAPVERLTRRSQKDRLPRLADFANRCAASAINLTRAALSTSFGRVSWHSNTHRTRSVVTFYTELESPEKNMSKNAQSVLRRCGRNIRRMRRRTFMPG